MRRIAMILLSLSLPAGTGAFAQEPIPLTLTECIRRALDNSPALRASSARTRAAEAQSTETAATLLPHLRLSTRAATLSDVPEFTLPFPTGGTQTLFPSIGHSYLVRLTLHQPLFTGFRLAKSAEIAGLHAEAAKEEFERQKAELVLHVTVAYWTLYHSINMEEVIAHSINQLSERLRETKNLAQQGLAIDADVLTVEARLSDLRLKLLEAQSAVRIARMTLNAQVGLPLDAVTRLVDVPSLPTAAAESADELAMLIKHARERRPDLKAMQRRTAVAEAGVVAARGGWFPQIALSANYDYARPNPRIIPSKDRWEGSWDVGVTLQWNVWDWSATSSQTAQAEANRAHSDALLEQLNDAVALDVAQQYFRRKEAIERIAVAELGVRQASESHRITTERFRQGLVTNSDMLTAETALLQARVAHTHALIDYLLATARLETAVGGNE